MRCPSPHTSSPNRDGRSPVRGNASRDPLTVPGAPAIGSPDDGRGRCLDSLQPVTVNKRLLFASLAVATLVVVAVGVAAASRSDSNTATDDVTLTSGNDLSPTIGTNAAGHRADPCLAPISKPQR